MTRKYPKFCDPTNDWAFKRIFGSEQYKAATIGFINSMLPERQICDVEFLNVEIPGFTAEDRKSCVDILCRGNDDSSFIIEMQIIEQECRTGAILPGAPEFFFLEPRRFEKKESELQTYQEKWLFLLRNAKSLSVIPETFSGDKAFDAYFSASETANMTKEERILYDQAMITKTDIEYGKLYSYKKGLAKGEAKGRKEGREAGREEGREEAQRELAMKMLLKGMSVPEISDLTGMPAEDLEKLKN